MNSEPNNIGFLCRLCASKTIENNRLNIFDGENASLDISSKITNCLGIEISESDRLPKVLCTECLSNLENFNKFKIESNKTANILLGMLESTGNKSASILLSILKNDNTDYESSDNLGSENNDMASNIFEPELHIETDESKIGNLSSKNKESLPIESNPDACNNMEIIFQCEYCNEGFLSYDISLMHVKLVHINNYKNKNKVNCVKAGTEKKKEKPIEPEIFKCDLCPRECVSKQKLKIHMQKHSNATHECTICDMKFKYETSLTRHIKLHNKEFDYVCNYCGKGMIGKAHFDYHVRTVHTKDYPFHCTKCDKKFPSKGGLKTHDQTVHNDHYSFSCELCNKCFKTNNNLQCHKKMHTPIEQRKKMQCNICQATFVSRSGYKQHLRLHTGELPHECQICSKRYKNKEGLKIHLLIHSGEKKYICEVCGKAFALRNSLIVHRRTHTGERPYQCNSCNKTFTQRSTLTLHIRKSCPRQ